MTKDVDISTKIHLKFAGRDYRVGRGRWPHCGSAALLFINCRTGAGLPASLPGNRAAQHPNEAFVIENDGILKTLVDAGLVKPGKETCEWEGLTLRACELVHPELIREADRALVSSDTAVSRRDEERETENEMER